MNKTGKSTAVLIVLLGLAAPAAARGIDCKRAATKLEKTICSDPKLLEQDATLAAIYAQALTSWKGAIASYVRLDQAGWLNELRMIGVPGEDQAACEITDRSCIGAELTARSDMLSSGTYANGGVYRSAVGKKLLLFPGKGNGYSLRIYDPAKLPDGHIATLQDENAGMWDGPDFMVARMGDANGLELPKPHDGPDEDGCSVRMAPAALSIRVWQKGFCGGRDYSGTNARLLDETLADYQTEIH